MNYINKLVRIKINDGVATAELHNPPLNILTLEMSAELRATFHKLEEDETVRVVVLRGSGEKAFSVGADIREFPQVWDDVIGKKLLNENLAIDAIELLEKPVIAALEGNTLGGGCEMAMAAEIRFMSETGHIGLPEIKLGVFPGSGGLYRLPRLVGIARAYEMLYTGKILNANEALTYGLVTHLTEPGKAAEEAVKLAKVIAAKPAEAIRLIKRGVRELWQKTTEENLRPNLALSRTVFKTADCVEGVDAFINKRKPNFRI